MDGVVRAELQHDDVGLERRQLDEWPRAQQLALACGAIAQAMLMMVLTHDRVERGVRRAVSTGVARLRHKIGCCAPSEAKVFDNSLGANQTLEDARIVAPTGCKPHAAVWIQPWLAGGVPQWNSRPWPTIALGERITECGNAAELRAARRRHVVAAMGSRLARDRCVAAERVQLYSFAQK